MDHADHVYLIQNAIPTPGGVLADLGSGQGAFTLALADLLGPGSELYSVDRDAGARRSQRRAMEARFPPSRALPGGDFPAPLDLPPLDGLVMANSLHFVRDKAPTVRRLGALLRPGGRWVLVEYNADRGNPWVPYPLSFDTWRGLAERCGLADTRLLATVPSRFWEIYAAGSVRPAGV